MYTTITLHSVSTWPKFINLHVVHVLYWSRLHYTSFFWMQSASCRLGLAASFESVPGVCGKEEDATLVLWTWTYKQHYRVQVHRNSEEGGGGLPKHRECNNCGLLSWRCVPVLMAQGEDSMKSSGTVESPAAHPLSFSYIHIINTFVHVNLYVVMALSSVCLLYTSDAADE